MTQTPAADQQGATEGEPQDTPKQRSHGLNRFTLLGRMTADPQLRYTASGKPVVNFSVATTFAGTTSFHRVVAWARSAEVLAEYGRRGREVFVEGHMKPTSRDVDGQRVHAVDLTVDVVHLLGRRTEGASEEAGQ